MTHVFNIRAFTGSRFRGKSNPCPLYTPPHPSLPRFSRYPFRRLWQVEPLLLSDQRAFSYQRALNLQWNCFNRPFCIMRPIMHLCSAFDMHKASRILYTRRPETRRFRLRGSFSSAIFESTYSSISIFLLAVCQFLTY